MSANVIEIGDYQNAPAMSGETRCLACGHEWVAVAPVGTVFLECPSCSLVKGMLKYPCEREGEHWECNCGNSLFHITPDGVYCPNCGEWAEGF